MNKKNMTWIAIATSLMCILAPISIPIGIVPISLTNFIIYFIVYILGKRKGSISCCLYLMIGALGLPVFSGFSGGLGKIFGATGGYLIGFVFLAFITGFFVEKFNRKIKWYVVGMILGTIVMYFFGTIWLAIQMKISFKNAIYIGVLPFIVGDTCKIVLVTIVVKKVRKQLLMLI